MKTVMVMFDSLNRRYLSPYGATDCLTPNFERLARHTVRFDSCYAGSLPCMPARRELHTGRYNFLHRSWGPMEPFDDSMPQILREHGIHSHLASDHTHYWEDGGANYHTRYSTWEAIRGQEGDPWKGVVTPMEDTDPNLVQFTGMRGGLYNQDIINRSYVHTLDDFPQTKTFTAGIEFIDTNHSSDNWFLQVECFDPHEPFFSSEEFQKLYPGTYEGGRFDWADYARVTETPEQIQELRRNYKALVSMCDASLGRILDKFDEYDLWKDTLLIVNTDHGYMLGEHDFWAKNYMPFYQEIVHLPLFIWDPVSGRQGQCCDALVQTIDLPATILEFFGLPVPTDMGGRSVLPAIRENRTVRNAGLFGIHGGHVCCTDGHYVFMKAPAIGENQPLYEYTLMPAHTTSFFNPAELENAQLARAFDFTKNMPVLQCPTICGIDAHAYGDMLFDIEKDYEQLHPLKDDKIRQRMMSLMVALMDENDAPAEQYQRLGLEMRA